MLHSNYQRLCHVTLPFAGRQKYMHSFDLAAPLMAPGFEDYLKPVVDLCGAAGAVVGIAHMTVDEKIVEAGMSQRRPGPHVDGCFMTDSWSHEPTEPPRGPWWQHPPRPEKPYWAHYCNRVPVDRMAVIVAATVAGCRAWRGEFAGHPTSSGDLSHITDQLGNGEVLPANVGYLLSPDCVHESMIFDQPTRRTFLRIALPVEFRSA